MTLAVIFDLDGTLVDSAPDIHAAVARCLAEEGLPALPSAQVARFVGNGVPVLIDRVIAACGLAAGPLHRDAMIARFLGHYQAALSDLTTVYPGVHTALNALQQAGHRMAVCTNKPAAAASSLLRAFDLAQYFPVVVGGDSLAVTKPHPAPLLEAIRLLGGGAAIFVGDSEVDAETAQAAGVPFVLFTEGYRKTAVTALPHHTAFSAYAALPTLVAALSAEQVSAPPPL